MLGLLMAFISAANMSSTPLSPMPKMRMEWETICSSESFFRYGTAYLRNIGMHSLGGPGIITTTLPSFSKAQPGAVPHSLWKTVLPSGSIACVKLLAVKARSGWI